ncbi:MAG: LemA family protein [Vagococcus fluvialis]|uniref:LemA family protein n=1 Tax=Vagococcus fluvialis TaxID=2738 RepID=UPI000A337C16|nr:LemA family protein [Vagococcus fluvialis]MBO0421207.1 LemA family protein [Vagococcus fluvialis]OTP33919.1 hypothetical protein A5798_000650 [Enterococcus sp. 6C8_DIV0013]
MEFKRSGVKQILISSFLFVFLFFIFSILFVMLDESIFGLYTDPEYINPITTLLAFLVAAIIILLEYLFSRANYVNKLENSADNIRSSISIYENKNNTLYNKANNLYLSFLNHEKEIHNNVANNNNESFLEINSVSTFNEAIQNYPNLKGDSHMSNLLNQIERSETELTNMKQHYNNIVSIYNEEISKLLMKAFTRKKRLEYYTEKESMEF